MGGDRAHTSTELRQREKDQQHPAWLAWLSAMPDALDEFLSKDVPGMPTDPWSADGLQYAEQAALRIFPTFDAVLDPENRGSADRFQRYVGEVFVRCFEGEWLNVPAAKDYLGRGFDPVVRRPFNDLYLTVLSQLTSAMDRRTGDR